ncbi:TolB family protein [Synechocystis sp. PCC 7509]|uniref:TolB family protein n=1 Tax=Synechocystis sp. PCC 7509 TaxID=927677 RepID=UPI0002DE540C|nr:PD40 domain-containing protein [Synechocystis sp. PCC 7509]
MKKFSIKSLLQRCWRWSFSLGLIVLIAACSPGSDTIINTGALNSRYTEEQPALSGNGRYLAYVSNRAGSRNILLYDLQLQQLVALPRLNRQKTIVENPSISYTGRYIVYITSNRGIPVLALYDRVTRTPQILNQWYQGLVRNPNISPDGRFIVFEGSRRGQWDIEVLDRGTNVELDLPDSPLPGISP